MSSLSKSKGFQKLKSIKRKTLVISKADLVSYRTFGPESPLPLVVEPKVPELNLPQWISENRDPLRQKLSRHGGLLFRGFKVEEIDVFQRAVIALSGELLSYMEQSSPRHAVEGKVYTSTDYPPNETIFLHNEQSYNLSWCKHISFYCPRPAQTGGRTPLADTREILARIDPEITARFRERQYMYMRNFGDGFGLTWQTAFQTESKAVVESYCRSHRIEFEWKEGNRLRTRQVRPAIHTHPETGEEVWFNHCTFFHVSTMPEQIRDNLISEFAEEDLPNQTFYGDGTSIEPEVVEHLRQVYHAEKVGFDWQKGDVLVLDNMLSSHGREPFTGPREVLVAMSNLVHLSPQNQA